MTISCKLLHEVTLHSTQQFTTIQLLNNCFRFLDPLHYILLRKTQSCKTREQKWGTQNKSLTLNTCRVVRSSHNQKERNDTTQTPTNILPFRETAHPCLSSWREGPCPLVGALFKHSSLVRRFPLRFLSTSLPPAPLGLFLTRGTGCVQPIQP